LVNPLLKDWPDLSCEKRYFSAILLPCGKITLIQPGNLPALAPFGMAKLDRQIARPEWV
jgi:hypothetical protein